MKCDTPLWCYSDICLYLKEIFKTGNWGVTRGISCHLVPGFTPSMARFVHNNINSKEVCRVFVLQCRSTSYLTSLVSSRWVHLSHTIYIQSYELHASIHTFIHPYINAFICSYINTFMRTQRTYIYTSSVYAWLH